VLGPSPHSQREETRRVPTKTTRRKSEPARGNEDEVDEKELLTRNPQNLGERKIRRKVKKWKEK
jgi:hypothetical protein